MKLNQERLVILLCILAGIRIFVFTAAFPFFSNVDEGAHFDMICKYASGDIPRRIEPYSSETAHMIPMFGSREYYTDWYDFNADEANAPAWTLPPEELAQPYREAVDAIVHMTNHDSTQFPVYYLAGAGWYRIGKAIGLRGGMLLYWLRFLNIPIYMLLVWVAYLMTRKLHPGNQWLGIGVPAILVVFPQDVFYSINSDVLAALLGALSLYLLLIYYIENRSKGFCILAGLSVAAAFLTKITNLPLLAFFGVTLIAKLVKSRRKGESINAAGLISIVLGAAIPIAAWLVRNKLVLGEISGSHAKIVRLGWTVKPLGRMIHHPIFTPWGAGYFWGELMRTFWRGEMIWHAVRLAWIPADIFYFLGSTAFLVAAAIVIRRRKEDRFAGIASFLMLGLSVGFLAGLSMIYDYHDCRYPSRDLPFFTSGRLILSGLVPFLMLYLTGLRAILDSLKIGRLRWMALGLILALMLGSEVLISTSVFASAYNFYHMLGSL